jgi:predicted CxxxxCH...CXXCH cytochrome family protein
MNTKIALTLLALFFITGCTPGSADSSGNVNESSQASAEGSSTTSSVISSHHQGQACLDCHGSSGEESFLSGGTVYTTLNATTSSQYANGYTIRLALENGQNVNYGRGRGTGNANSDDPRMLSYKFTAQVLDSSSNVVTSSATDSHDYTRVDCNRCHTSTGSGNPKAPGRITTAMPSVTPPTDPGTTTGTTTTTGGQFQSTVLPVLMATCSSTNCHGGGNGGRLTVTPDANATYTSIMAFNGVDTANAPGSLLLTKASNTVVHGGGIILLTTEAKYITIRDWIASGAALGAVTTTTTGTVNIASYASYVYPTLTNRCTACHSSGSGRGFIVSTSAATYSNLAAYINKTSPASSLILTKNNGTVTHSGGKVLTTAESANIEAWIAAGALNN